MGAVAFTQKKTFFNGNRRVVTCIGTPSTAYATGGETLDLRRLGLTRPDWITVSSVGSGTTGYVPKWNANRTAPTIILSASSAIAGDPLVEETAGTNVSTFPMFIRIYGV